MSTWTTGLEGAPQDKMLLVDLDGWQCPVLMQWEPPDDMHGGFWRFCDELISDASDPLDAAEISQAKWALVPE